MTRLRIATLVLVLALAACAQRDTSDEGDRRGTFYGGVSGGWTHP